MIIKVCQFQAHRQLGERLVEVFQPGEMEKAASFFSMGKTAAPEAEAGASLSGIAGSVRRGAGHVWDAANKGAQTAAEHLEAKGAPKIVSGAIHAAPVALAGYGIYRGLKGLNNWNTNRVMRSQMQGGY